MPKPIFKRERYSSPVGVQMEKLILDTNSSPLVEVCSFEVKVYLNRDELRAMMAPVNGEGKKPVVRRNCIPATSGAKS